MSCTICGQDVPVVPTTEDADTVTCVRCGATFSWTTASRSVVRLDQQHGLQRDTIPATRTLAEPPPLVASDDDWDEMYDPSPTWRGDSHASKSTYRTDRVTSPIATTKPEPVCRHRSTWLQWTILSLGVGLFSCGAALIAWSFGEDRQYLWNVGAPLALAGQAAFLIGLVLQLDLIWQHSKQTSRRLDDLDQRVAPTSEAATGAAEAPRDPRSTFDADESRAPETLLDELKGQLDRMATRLTRNRY